MLNSAAAGRRQARQVVIVQTVTAALVALAFLVDSVASAAGAGLAGVGVAVGSALMAWRSLPDRMLGAGAVLSRLAGGIALKWLVIAGALYLALARFELPPVPVVTGLSAALIASLLAYRIK